MISFEEWKGRTLIHEIFSISQELSPEGAAHVAQDSDPAECTGACQSTESCVIPGSDPGSSIELWWPDHHDLWSGGWEV